MMYGNLTLSSPLARAKTQAQVLGPSGVVENACFPYNMTRAPGEACNTWPPRSACYRLEIRGGGSLTCIGPTSILLTKTGRYSH